MDIRAEILKETPGSGIPKWVEREIEHLATIPIPDEGFVRVMEVYLERLPPEAFSILPHLCTAWCVKDRHTQVVWVTQEDGVPEILESLEGCHRLELMDIILIEKDNTSPPAEVCMKDHPEQLRIALAEKNTAPWRIFFTPKEGVTLMPGKGEDEDTQQSG